MATSTNPFEEYPTRRPQRDDWEDWEDDSDSAVHTDDLLVDLSGATVDKSNKPLSQQHHSSVHRPIRVKSKGRQKAQNVKAGIKVVTDMSKFRFQTSQQQQLKSANRSARDETRGKFVDTTALLALEGEPTSASIGSFSWLKKKPGNMRKEVLGKKTAQDASSDLSPAAGPIVIGIAVPSDDVSRHQVSPQTAVLETPLGMGVHPQRQATNAGYTQAQTPQQQQRSVWSPDTEESDSPYSSRRAASSIYSQPSMYGIPPRGSDAPPVPAVPATFKSQQSMGAARTEDDDEMDTPCTLFEEDGSPQATRKSYRPKATTVSPDSAASRSHGWWDHITTPFAQSNPFRMQAQETGASSSTAPPPPPQPQPQDWWAGVDEKKARQTERASGPSGLAIITPQYTAQSTATSHSGASRAETHSEKAQILRQENESPTEQPPPYSPPKESHNHQVKYQAIFPPSHGSTSQAIPSPGPVTPNLPGTMTSQGAIKLADIPLTPADPRAMPPAVLPDRPIGAYAIGDHFHDARGPAWKSERQRRRHEKEEAVARKAGGFWRGRGCISSDGCFGRTGREGRKRRRVCLGVCGGVIALIILAVVLGVVLTRKAMGVTQSAQEAEEASIWLNITDFPPIPTGVLTVAGPENIRAESGCLDNTTETAWACSLPKEEHDSVAPYLPNQPEFVFQIQYDNDTRALWNITDPEDQPKDANSEDSETGLTRRRVLTAPGISPKPEPPSTKEMVFLGNTTDKIQSDNKAGEPTPFYISLIPSVDEPVGLNILGRRQGFNNAIGGANDNGTADSDLADLLPAPVSNPDGTGAAARLFPLARQQPLRLFDRGLDTEHYGFYTYFDKRTYLTDKDDPVSADKDGGARLSEAKFVATFTETRFLVQIWTRRTNATELLLADRNRGRDVEDDDADAEDSNNDDGTEDSSTRPGTMPYPVTVVEDMHGGNPTKKTSFYFGVDDGQVNTTVAGLVGVDRGFRGTLVNPMARADRALGGVDGGTGGCACEWRNFRER